MPHIIIEYSKTLGEIIEIPRLVKNVHKALSEQDIDLSKIRTRAYACNYNAVGELNLHGHMLHVTILLLEGREEATKRRYGDAIYKILKSSVEGVVRSCAVSLEIRDMAKNTYYQ